MYITRIFRYYFDGFAIRNLCKNTINAQTYYIYCLIEIVIYAKAATKECYQKIISR